MGIEGVGDLILKKGFELLFGLPQRHLEEKRLRRRGAEGAEGAEVNRGL